MKFIIFLLIKILSLPMIILAFNSPPVFDFKREIFVPEDTPIGQMVTMVRTIDKEKDIITYGIDPAHWNDGSKYFRIDEKTGQIFLRESLNGQGGNFLNMYIKANDGHQTAKIEAVISVSKINDKGQIVHFPDSPSLSSTHVFNVNNILSINNSSRLPPPPKDVLLDVSIRPPAPPPPPPPPILQRKQRPPINKLNRIKINNNNNTNNNNMNNETKQSIINDDDDDKIIDNNNIDDKINKNFYSNDNKTTSTLISNIIWPIGPYILLSVFVPILCLIFWCWIHKRNIPSRNAIKTFSHKIINNNNNNNNNNNTKSDHSIETITNNSFVNGDFDCSSSSLSTLSYKQRYYETNNNDNIDDNKIMIQNLNNKNHWEFPRHHLRFIHILGHGCFGQVWKCEIYNTNNTTNNANNNNNYNQNHFMMTTIPQIQIVAVKTLKENAGEKEKRDLLDELEVMKILDPHPNVVTLIGCCTERDPVYLIMEYVPYGKLQKYLIDNRDEITYSYKQQQQQNYPQKINNNNNRIESQDLISFAYQIAKGMEYLSSKGIIHRDLAARNILVGHNKICKIADFGLAKYNQEIYERKSEGRLPIRWMAIESLKDFIFTTKSDVWSFGILMWEIVTLGCTPYPGFTASEVIKKVNDGYRLEKPEHCKREMYNIMYYCWDRNPHNRPTFNELVCLLDNLFSNDDEYIELDRFPDHCYYNLLKPPSTNNNNNNCENSSTEKL